MAASPTAFFEAIRATGPGRAESLARIEALANLLDTAFVIPGTRMRFGLDAIIGLVPVVGDAVSALLSGYIIWEARQLGLPRWKIARMVANVAFDTAIGIVPFVGDIADTMFKSNRRNLRIVLEHLGQDGPGGGRAAPEGRDRVIDAEYRVVRDGR